MILRQYFFRVNSILMSGTSLCPIPENLISYCYTTRLVEWVERVKFPGGCIMFLKFYHRFGGFYCFHLQWDSRFLRNVDKIIPDYTASVVRMRHYSGLPPWEPHLLIRLVLCLMGKMKFKELLILQSLTRVGADGTGWLVSELCRHTQWP
jgi:hypothetical protein